MSVREVTQRCGVDKNTFFLWRHRFLKTASAHRAEHEGGIVEADETFFTESFKGQRKLHRPARKCGGVGDKWEQIAMLVERDRNGQTADFRVERLDARYITAVLQPLIDKDVILCTDGARVYQTFARLIGITHRPINVQQDIRAVGEAFHIQNVNAHDNRPSQRLNAALSRGSHQIPGELPRLATHARRYRKTSRLLTAYAKRWKAFPQQLIQT